MVTTCWHQAHRPQTGWNQKVENPVNQKKGHELMTHLTTLSPNTVFRNLVWKPLGSSGLLSMSHLFSLLGPCNKGFSAPNSDISFVWPHCAEGTWTWVRQQGHPMWWPPWSVMPLVGNRMLEEQDTLWCLELESGTKWQCDHRKWRCPEELWHCQLNKHVCDHVWNGSWGPPDRFGRVHF